MTSEVGEAFEQATDGLVDVVTIEVVGTKVGVLNAIAEHMVGGREHGSGHRENGLLATAAGFDTQELSVQIAGFDPYRSPGRRHQGGLEPGATLAHARAAPLSGALVVARAQPRPRHQVAGVGKARHVDADLRQEDLSGQVANPGDRGQQAGAVSDRRQRFSHDCVEFGQRVLQCANDVQVQFQHRAVVLGNASVPDTDYYLITVTAQFTGAKPASSFGVGRARCATRQETSNEPSRGFSRLHR